MLLDRGILACLRSAVLQTAVDAAGELDTMSSYDDREAQRAFWAQELRERHVRLELERRERETRLVHSCWWERISMGMAVILFLFAVISRLS